MSFNRNNKKTVSFREVGEPIKFNRNKAKKGSILKRKKVEEEKVSDPIENKIENKKMNIQIEEPINSKNNSLKYLPTDEYFKLTVQKALEQGLLNIAMVHPTDPIRFLGNFLIEKSKSSSIV